MTHHLLVDQELPLSTLNYENPLCLALLPHSLVQWEARFYFITVVATTVYFVYSLFVYYMYQKFVTGALNFLNFLYNVYVYTDQLIVKGEVTYICMILILCFLLLSSCTL